jgi:hypothetical protein
VSLLQNLSLNIADKGFPISVYNRSYEKTEAAVARAQKEGGWWQLTHLAACTGLCCGHQGLNRNLPLYLKQLLHAAAGLAGYKSTLGWSSWANAHAAAEASSFGCIACAHTGSCTSAPRPALHIFLRYIVLLQAWVTS